jgi:hypothetical protein
LGKAAQIETLDLAHTSVTDTGLARLRGMKALFNVNVYATGVTEQGIRRLQEHLPRCEIDVNESPLDKLLRLHPEMFER